MQSTTAMARHRARRTTVPPRGHRHGERVLRIGCTKNKRQYKWQIAETLEWILKLALQDEIN